MVYNRANKQMKKRHIVFFTLMVLLSLCSTSCIKFGSECTCKDTQGNSFDIDPSDYGADNCSEACGVWARLYYAK